MIVSPQRYREEQEREWAQALRRLTYAESLQRTEELLSCGLLEQVQLRRADQPVALRYLLHGGAR